MFKKGERVYVAEPELIRERYSDAYGIVTLVISAAHRSDTKKDLADQIVVVFKKYDGIHDITEKFDETELQIEHRSARGDMRPGWEKNRRTAPRGWFAKFRLTKNTWSEPTITKDN